MSIVRKDRLLARWSRKEKDFKIAFPNKPDGHFLYGLLSTHERLSSGRTLLEELELRGYDITTLRIQVDRKKKNVAL